MSKAKKIKLDYPRELPYQPIRWRPLEIIGILNFLNENFDMWCSSRLNACIKAKDATNIAREGKAIYTKIHTMFKDLEDFNRKGKKSTANAMIWEDDRIYRLLDEFYNKTVDRRMEENKRSADDDDFETTTNTNDQVNVEESINEFPKVPTLYEMVEKLCNKKMQDIDQVRSNLIKTIENTNNTLEKSNYQLQFSVEEIDNTYDGKTQQILQLRSELMKAINDVNEKYEELKNFQ